MHYAAIHLINRILLNIKAFYFFGLRLSEPQKRNNSAARAHIHCLILFLRRGKIGQKQSICAKGVLRCYLYINIIGKSFVFCHSLKRLTFRKNYLSSSEESLSTAINASCGTSTVPKWRMRFLPSFCFSSNFFFRVTSPP